MKVHEQSVNTKKMACQLEWSRVPSYSHLMYSGERDYMPGKPVQRVAVCNTRATQWSRFLLPQTDKVMVFHVLFIIEPWIGAHARHYSSTLPTFFRLSSPTTTLHQVDGSKPFKRLVKTSDAHQSIGPQSLPLGLLSELGHVDEIITRDSTHLDPNVYGYLTSSSIKVTLVEYEVWCGGVQVVGQQGPIFGIVCARTTKPTKIPTKIPTNENEFMEGLRSCKKKMKRLFRQEKCMGFAR